jgi:60S ribosomal protein uL30
MPPKGQEPAKKTTEAPKATAVAQKKEEAKTTPVPETLLKKRKTQQQLKEAALKRQKNIKKKVTLKRRVIFKKAEKYLSEYRRQERNLINARRVAKKGGNLFLNPEAKVAFVIRIRGTQGLPPKPRKILQLLRLRQVNNGAFVKLTRATKQMLTLIEPYITYGYPSLKTVRELVYKRGYAKINKQRLPLTNNKVIEDTLGKFGIICVEDLIHEIFTVGPNFKYANRFLWTFKLSPPVRGWTHILTHYNDGGDFGNREDKINELVERMN